MKKKLLGTLFLGAFSISNLANAAVTPCDYDGFYIGVSGGVANTFGKLTTEAEADFTIIADDGFVHGDPLIPIQKSNFANGSLRASKNRAIGGINLGASWLCDCFYLGGELGAYYSPRYIKQTITNNESNLSTDNLFITGTFFTSNLTQEVRAKLNNWEWTADLTPGVLLCDTYLLYGRVGVAFNRIKLDTSTNFLYNDLQFPLDSSGTAIPTPTTVNVCLPGSASKKRAALRLGVGIASYIADNFVLSFNYTYTDYGKVSVTSATSIHLPGVAVERVMQGLYSDTKIRIMRQNFTVGLNYYFGGLFS